MKNFYNSKQKPVHLILGKDRLRELKRGYPWVFRHQLVELPPAKSGTLAVLKDRKGQIVAKGFYDPESQLSFRVLTLADENIQDKVIESRILRAINYRKQLFGKETTGYRVINGEGDFLPGLVCDRYGAIGVIQFDGEGPKGFYNGTQIASTIAKCLNLDCVYYKPRHSESGSGINLFGTVPDGNILFLENSIKFEVDVKKGQKTGFFLDQRDNRNLIAPLSKGKTLLNLFGYNGGFSIYAGYSGAKHVTTVDLAKPAIASALRNWELNGLDPDLHSGVVADVFDYLEQAKQEKKNWDIVVVDPPSFAHAAKSVEVATKSYIDLLCAAIKVTSTDGILAASSCSSHINPEMFLDLCREAISKSRRTGRVLGIYGQPLDHPFPLACSELRYLKFVLLEVG